MRVYLKYIEEWRSEHACPDHYSRQFLFLALESAARQLLRL